MATRRRGVAEFSARSMTEILDSMEPRLERAFLRMIAELRAQLGPNSLDVLIREGRTEEAVELYGEAIRLFSREASNLFVEAGAGFAAFVANAVDVVVGFDQFSESAVRYIRESELTTIREFTREQREVVRHAVTDGIARGLNPIDQARQFRDSIGLTRRQQDAVESYRRALESGTTEALSRELRDRRFDGTVRRAAREGEPLTRQQIDRMVGRYADRYVKYRAETIARDQSLTALHAAQEEAFDQILGGALFDASNIIQVWNIAGDERVRPAHQFMDGQERGPGEPFTDGDGNEIRFPGDPEAPIETRIQCRCVKSIRIVLHREDAKASTVEERVPQHAAR